MQRVDEDQPCTDAELYPRCGIDQLCPAHDPLRMGVAPVSRAMVTIDNRGGELNDAEARLYYMDKFPDVDKAVIDELVKAALCNFALSMKYEAVTKAHDKLSTDMGRLDQWLKTNMPAVDRATTPNPVDAAIDVLQLILHAAPALWRAIVAVFQPVVQHAIKVGIIKPHEEPFNLIDNTKPGDLG